MQNKLFRDAFAASGLDITRDLIPIDVRDMTTEQAVEKVSQALKKLEEAV